MKEGNTWRMGSKEARPGKERVWGRNQFLWSTFSSVQFSSVQSLSRVRLFVTPRIAARQASLSITNSRSLLKPMSIASVMPSNHLILCRPLLLLPPICPSIRVFSNGHHYKENIIDKLCLLWKKRKKVDLNTHGLILTVKQSKCSSGKSS